jgi:hypothetical protein
MIKPIKLFGIEQRDKEVIFIHLEGEGYWFVKHGHRTVGEARDLSIVASKIEKEELANNWLILKIINENETLLIEEYKTKNTENLSVDDIDAFTKRDKSLHLEKYVRELISDLDLFHPALVNYKSELTDRITGNLMFEYQLACIKAAFNYRFLNIQSEEEFQNFIKVSDDPEKGYISAKTLTGHPDILGTREFDIADLPEPLATKIFTFIQNEYNGRETLTTQETEKQELENIEKNKQLETPIEADTDSDNDEKKQFKKESQKPKIEPQTKKTVTPST